MISQGCVVKKSCDSMDDFLKFQVLWCLSKFHVHRPCQRGCVTLLRCHVTTHHQVVRGSCNSIVGFFSLQVPNPYMYCASGTDRRICCNVRECYGRRDTSFQFFPWLHEITWSEGYYGWVALVIKHHSAKFGGHWLCRRGDILLLICHLTSCDYSHARIIQWVMWHYGWLLPS